MAENQAVVCRNGLTLTRRDVVGVLLFPGRVPEGTTAVGVANLRGTFAQEPDSLSPLGLQQVTVYAVCAYAGNNPGGHRWRIQEKQIWVDQETGTPLDNVVTILEGLPAGYESRDGRSILALLPPSYCRRQQDAEALLAVVQRLESGAATTSSR